MSPRRAADDVLGVALTPGMVVAAAESVPTVWERGLDLNGGANGARDALGAALDDAAKASGLTAPALAVALLPPLAETRTITLPPLREEDRNRFLQRNAPRYFVGARGAQVIGTALAGGAAKGAAKGATKSATKGAANGAATASVVATSASRQLVEAVHAASALAGCDVRAVVPAEAAWAAAAVAIWPAFARGPASLVVAHDERADVLALHDGVLSGVRRFRGAGDAAAIADVATGPVGVIGAPDAAGAMAGALGGAGACVARPDGTWTAFAERPDALAARFAAVAAGPEIRSEETRERDLATVRRVAWTVLAAAGVVLLVSVFVHYQGVRRELAHVRAERAALRSQVEASLVGRSSVDAAYRQVAALAAASRAAPRWSVVLADLTTQLSDDASLTAFRARGDSIFIDGVATQAAPVFDELARVPGVTGVRATAPVRRESVEGQAPVEHFSLGAQVVRGRP